MLDPENSTSNIIINSEHHPLFFLSDFSLFCCFFVWKSTHFEMCNGPWKQHHTPFFLFFLLFYLFINGHILFICKCNFFYGNVHWTLKWWGCREGMKLLLKWKMKCFLAGMQENERNFILLLQRPGMKQVQWMNENPFHSFTVADQVFLWHLPVIHDVNGSSQSVVAVLPRESGRFLDCGLFSCYVITTIVTNY